jgi:hypothetical protein
VAIFSSAFLTDLYELTMATENGTRVARQQHMTEMDLQIGA